MTAIFNQVDFIHRLEKEGIGRGAAETIALGIEEGRSDLVTKQELEHALSRQTVQFGVMLGATTALLIAAMGMFSSLS